MERYSFSDIFEVRPDGTLSPKRKINVNGVTFGPGVAFGPEVKLGGVKFHKYKNFDIGAEKMPDDPEVLIIKGFY